MRCQNGKEAGNREWRKSPQMSAGCREPRGWGGVGGGCSLPCRGVIRGRGLRSQGVWDTGKPGGGVRCGQRGYALFKVRVGRG